MIPGLLALGQRRYLFYYIKIAFLSWPKKTIRNSEHRNKSKMKNEKKPLLVKKKKYGVEKEDCEREDQYLLHDEEKNEDKAAWLVVAASFLCICVLDGTMYSFGAFLEPLMADMKQARGTISMSGSLQVALSAFVAPVAGILVKKLGARKVCIAGAVTASFGLLLASFGSNLVGIFGGLSLLNGVGFGLMYIAAVVVVAETFNKNRSLAIGLALCGAGAGQVGMAPLVSWVVGTWGWRIGLQVLAAITLGCVGLSSFMKKTTGKDRPEEKETEEDGINRRPLMAPFVGKAISNHDNVYVFILMVLADALSVMALYIPYSYLRPVAEAVGVASQLSSILISAVGVGSVTGRLLAGWLSDQPWCHPLYLTRAVISLSCVVPFLLAWVDHLWMFIGLSIMFGFLTGQWIAATSPLLVSLLGLKQLSSAFGLLTAVRGVACLVSPPFAGILVDITANPIHALYLSGLLLGLSGLIYSGTVWIYKKTKIIPSMYEEI